MELVVLSGKGGTGKTTIATALAELAKDVVRIDCDVDAPNFYLFYKGHHIEKNDFYAGKKAEINDQICTRCELCQDICRFNAIEKCKVNTFICEGCGACTLTCPQNAIKMKDEKIAETFIMQLDNGIISTAEMEIGSDGSGKLITFLRKNGNRFAENEKLTIIDGSPGIGCPVISSITGSSAALIVTEPTKSGLEDLIRVASLCEHFGVFTMACINKYDINIDMTIEIENYLNEHNIKLVQKIPYDEVVIKSVNELIPIIYYEESKAGKTIKSMWNSIKDLIF